MNDVRKVQASGWAALVLVLLVAGAEFLTSCKKKKDRQVVRGGYFWQGMPQQDVLQVADSLQLAKHYVKFFDLDYSPVYGAYPLHVTDWQSYAYRESKAQMVPVVFITQNALKNLRKEDIDTLAGKIVRKLVMQLGNEAWLTSKPTAVYAYDSATLMANAPRLLGKPRNNPAYYYSAYRVPAIAEVQFDCDWTATTRDVYFALLKSLKARLAPATVSATIRLHQFAHPGKTGVPPVDRGMLMAYNFQSPTNAEARNSIMDTQIAEPYLDDKPDYPLPLDLALPVFRWGLLYRRDKLVGIINNAQLNTFTLTDYFHDKGNGAFLAKQDTALGQLFLHEGDRLRLEQVHVDEAREIARLCEPYVAAGKASIVLFDYQSDLVQRYSYENLGKVYGEFE